MLLASVFRWNGVLYIFGHGGVRLGLALAGITVRVAGAEHLPLDRAAVYCANHQSNIDPPVLFTALHPRMHIVYKAEINAIPLLARAFQLRRLRADRAAQQGSGDAIARGRRRARSATATRS